MARKLHFYSSEAVNSHFDLSLVLGIVCGRYLGQAAPIRSFSMHQDDKTTPVEQDRMAQPEQALNANQRHRESRRRLLQAAAVAPVIYTLPNGSAFAAVSTCLRNEENTIDVTGVVNEECASELGNGNASTSGQTNSNAPQNLNSGCETEAHPQLTTNQGTFTYAGRSTRTGEPYYADGESNSYVYDGQQLWTASCWSSVNVASIGSTKAFQNIV